MTWTRYATFSGVALLAIIWGVWLTTPQEDDRARLLMGTLLAFPVGIVSRLMQRLVRSHPRPYHDPALRFHHPTQYIPSFNTWNSFPSDHATVFGVLLLMIWMIRPKVGLWMSAWLLIVEFARTYMGAHYPTDIFAGLALAGLARAVAPVHCPGPPGAASGAKLAPAVLRRRPSF